ncbi:hypothetical protein EJ04DRAFT_594256 [Polyplosphaeria fusca]|uniref:Transmembrane protein n=1 Tax=Polyplosphaeria fusca TaxID=682080 RepID=A0A9P4UX00_9PLEO|nr:hypothetical protein EJ04DRAFT_594256 [Polyplosphaeria fusca]
MKALSRLLFPSPSVWPKHSLHCDKLLSKPIYMSTLSTKLAIHQPTNEPTNNPAETAHTTIITTTTTKPNESVKMPRAPTILSNIFTTILTILCTIFTLILTIFTILCTIFTPILTIFTILATIFSPNFLFYAYLILVLHTLLFLALRAVDVLDIIAVKLHELEFVWRKIEGWERDYGGN